MMIIKSLFVVATAMSLSSATYSAPEYWLADIRVNTVKVVKLAKHKYICKTVIASSNDDDARGAKAFIMLAPETTFISSSIKNLNPAKRNDGLGASCKRSTTRGHLNSYVECKLGDLSTSAKLQISIKGKVNSPRYKPACSVFVISSTPDHKIFNNFKKSR